MSSTALDGGIRLRYVQVASVTIADGPGAAPGDLARLTIEDSRVAGPITSLPGAHAALLIANGSSRPTLLTSALTESSTELDGNIDLRSGSIVANNVRLTGMTMVTKEKWWTEAYFSAPLETAVLAGKPWLPPEISKRIRFR